MNRNEAEKIKAFCCECNELTTHKYNLFGQSEYKPHSKTGFIKALLLMFVDAQEGDYKCAQCGTYLNTPDNLD